MFFAFLGKFEICFLDIFLENHETLLISVCGIVLKASRGDSRLKGKPQKQGSEIFRQILKLLKILKFGVSISFVSQSFK